ncbi:hypothetical protein D044_2615B, partial [Vibrio parahaemolyticus EKP-026]
AIVTRQVED